MSKKSDAWYIHAILYVLIAVLAFVLINVAIIQPREITRLNEYWKNESRARMTNILQAQILWEEQHERFTDDLDSLVDFVKNDSTVLALMTGTDSITGKSSNPFKPLTSGEFTPDSLKYSPKSGQRFQLAVDTTVVADTFITRSGRISKIDTTITIGTLYHLTSPDSDDEIGSTENNALKNTTSWE